MENTRINDTILKLSNLDEYDEAFKKFIIESSDKLMFKIEPLLSMCTFENREVIGKAKIQVNDEWI